MGEPFNPTAVVFDPISQAAKDKLFATADYLSAEEKVWLEKACAFAHFKHGPQIRKSGEPYITHPLAVATEVAQWHLDITALMAALMHDVLEDTPTSKAEMAAEFNEEVANIVDGLSKLEKFDNTSREQNQAESLRKLLIATVTDIRVILIKLADRLHNMRTLHVMRPDKQKRIAQETRDIYAHLANRLGLHRVYRELMDLSFRYLYPLRHRVLKAKRERWKSKRRDAVTKILCAISLHLAANNLEAKVKERQHTLYRVYRLMREEHKSFDKVMDVYGIQIIVPRVSDCYLALGVMHDLYKPKENYQIRDYIALPKHNGYQSLHTNLMGPFGMTLEVQIRTRDMDQVAESGIASRWLTQKTATSHETASLRMKQWLQSVLEMEEDSSDALEFLQNIKTDLNTAAVIAFTPRGKVIELPPGATPIDFAYAVHTDIGNRCTSALVNGVLAPLRTPLNSGDIVQIITHPNSRPNPNWISFVVTSYARNAIRRFLGKIKREEAIELGRNLLQQVLLSMLPEEVLVSEDFQEHYLETLAEQKMTHEDVLYEVGMGRLKPLTVAKQMAILAGERFGETVKLNPLRITGSGMGNVSLANCCNPIPQDPIRAILTKDQGVLIHRDSCHNLLRADPDNILDADWDILDTARTYAVQILVTSRDSHGLLGMMAQTISATDANIYHVNTPSLDKEGLEGFIEFKFGLAVRNLTHLEHIIRNLSAIPQVQKVSRL